MRKALIVGIDAYSTFPLSGCVNDAQGMQGVLSRHEDGTPNFTCRVLTAPREQITRAVLRQQIDELFSDAVDTALFYFSGHGYLAKLGGFLVTQDAGSYDEGVAMRDLLDAANNSKAREVLIVLDCCYSGAVGKAPALKDDYVQLRQGVSVLTASGAEQTAAEWGGSGVFTSLVRAALEGGASDTLGNVTVAALYAYVDQLLGAWDQRPTFTSHVSRLTPLRKCKPQLDLAILRLLPQYFVTVDGELQLDPSHEPTEEPHDAVKEEIFSHLQKFRAARLLVPVGEEHMYYAAISSKSCKLTPLGQFYWQLAQSGKL